MTRRRIFCAFTVYAGFLLLAALTGCDRGSSSAKPNAAGDAPATVAPAPAAPATVEVLFTYGSEKQKWIDDVTAAFNASGAKVAAGPSIHVTAVAGGSGETMEDLLAGRVQAHIWSPASGAFVKLGNARSAATQGGPLVGATRELVLSPVVIAMWRPMAEALGWPAKPVGWSDVIALAKDPRGWAAHGHAEWGPFKLGHTHPEYSNSGLISILAESYAGAGKVRDLTAADLADPRVGKYVEDVERSVVHYGRSTGFFGRRLFQDGPQFLSAVVLYENMVVESYAQAEPTALPLVAVYPKEGTFWSDHPIGIVQRAWVDDGHREAAQMYIDFLRAPPQQAKALTYGFRPAEGDIGAPIDAAHGVDARQPSTILEMPSADVVNGAIDLWRQHKKPATVVVVFDRSGSMQEEGKMAQAKAGAMQLVDMLGPRDAIGVVPFSTDVVSIPPVPLAGTGRQRVGATFGSLFPGGQTNLYEAILAGHGMLAASPDPGRIRAVVVLTDGEDNGTRVSLAQLLNRLRVAGEQSDVRVFTIGYGKSARLDALKKVSEETHGQFFEGAPQNIKAVFQDIATFF